MMRMNDPDASSIVKGVCGDTMEMYLLIDNKRITRTTFFTDGCVSSKACGSITASMSEGRTIMEALNISPGNVLTFLLDIPGIEIHCAILAVTTLHRAIAEYILRFGEENCR